MLLHCLYVILFIIIIPSLNDSLYGSLNALILSTFVCLSILSHARAAYFDPGFVPLPRKGIDFSDAQTNEKPKPNGEGWTICNRCDTYRPGRAHHCRVCKRCVRRMDHHCPWINNCVGEFNQKYFMLFLFYVGVTSLYSASFVIWSLVVFPQKTEAQIVHSVIICIESCLFGLFVITIFVDQVYSIVNDRSLIDSLKADPDSLASPNAVPAARVLFRQVFGPGPMILWLLPCDLRKTTPATDLYNMYHV